MAKTDILDMPTLARLGSMQLLARTVVEGFILGLHQSPYRGFSVEFAEHRQYVPGDEESLPAQRWFAEWIRRCRVVIVPPTSVVEHAALRSTAQTQAVKAIAGKKSRR